MIAQELEVSLHMAFVEARQARHEFITVEHLLLALLDNPSAAEVLRACAVNIEDLRKTLTNFIGDNTPTVPGTGEVDTQPPLESTPQIRKQRPSGRLLLVDTTVEDEHDPIVLRCAPIRSVDLQGVAGIALRRRFQDQETAIVQGRADKSSVLHLKTLDREPAPRKEFAEPRFQEFRRPQVCRLGGKHLQRYGQRDRDGEEDPKP